MSPLENWNFTVLVNETEFTLIVLVPKTNADAGALNQFPLAVDLTTLYCAPSGNEVMLIVNDCASPKLPSSITQEVKKCVQVSFGPSLKILQSLIVNAEGSGTHPEFTPFTLKASNSMSPLENWNLTALEVKSASLPV